MNRRNFLSRSLAAVSALAVVDSVRHVEGEVLPKAAEPQLTYYSSVNGGIVWSSRPFAPQKIWVRNGIFYQLTTNEQGKWRIAAKSSNGSTWTRTT